MKPEKLILIAALGLGALVLSKKASAQGYVINPQTGQRTAVATPMTTQNGQLANQINGVAALVGGIKNIFTGGGSSMAQTIAKNVPYYSAAEVAAQDNWALGQLAYGPSDSYAANPIISGNSYESWETASWGDTNTGFDW